MNALRLGMADLAAALRRWHLVRLLAWYDLGRKNVESRLGVFWHSLSFFAVVASLGYLYSAIFGQPAEVYVPWLAGGFVGWRYISQVLTEGLGLMQRSKGIVTQIPMPLSLFVLRAVLVHLMTLGLNLLGFAAVMLVFGLVPHSQPLALLAGLLLLVLTGVGITLCVALLAVFQRWLQNLLPPLMQLSFLVTPIIWMPEFLLDFGHASGGFQLMRSAVLDYNPLYHYLEVFRGPLIGIPVAGLSWLVAGAGSVLLLLLGAWMLGRYRNAVLLRM